MYSVPSAVRVLLGGGGGGGGQVPYSLVVRHPSDTNTLHHL